MTGNADIERELDRWLTAGVDVLPARVIDSALARIDTTSQRRARRVSPRRNPTMSTMIRLAAAAALLVLATGGLLLVGSGRLTVSPPPSAEPSASSDARVAPAPAPTSQTPRPTPAPTPRPTAAPTPIWSIPPLSDRFVSPGYGYSVQIPAGFDTAPATSAWDPAMTTDMASPWLERAYSSDGIVTFTARSVALDRPMSTEEWRAAFEAAPDGPAGPGETCEAARDWEPVAVGDATGSYYHEQCGPLWAVATAGDLGYVFTIVFNVYDTEDLSAPFVELFKEMLASVELTPDTAGSLPAPAP